jgi:hypothetical protein
LGIIHRPEGHGYGLSQLPEGLDLSFAEDEIRVSGDKIAFFHEFQLPMSMGWGVRLGLTTDEVDEIRMVLPSLFEVGRRVAAIAEALQVLFGRAATSAELDNVCQMAARVVLDHLSGDEAIKEMMDLARPGVDLRPVIFRHGIPRLLEGK